MQGVCIVCECSLEPVVNMVPYYNGGTVPESVEEEIVGYYPCDCQDC